METLQFTKVRDVKSITKAHPEDAGFDFFVPNDCGEIKVQPQSDVLIPSGIKVKVPHGYALIAYNKSGVCTKQKLRVGACVVDENYQGEVHIHLFNDSPIWEQLIVPGQKIVQFVLVRIGNHQAEEISNEEYHSVTTERGDGAFGSTGV